MYENNELSNWQGNLDESSKMFEKVWPLIRDTFFVGSEARFVSCENHANEVETILDQWYGIDGFICFSNKTKPPISCAVRIQEGRSYDTFTVRSSRSGGAATELQKRESGEGLGPAMTIQIYVCANEITIGIVKTKNLYDYIKRYSRSLTIEKGPNGLMWERINNDGKSSFICVPWSGLTNIFGVPVHIVKGVI